MIKKFAAFCTVVMLGLVFTHYKLRGNISKRTENQVSRESLLELQSKHSFHIINTKKSSKMDSRDSTQDSHSTRGFVLAGGYWEQFSSASRNLQNLQCWAGKFGAKVLEPYSENSMLRSILGPLGTKLRFSDMIDLEHWNRESVRMGHGEVVHWNTFLNEAPKDIIVVDFKFKNKTTTNLPAEVKKNPGNFLSREIRYTDGCSQKPRQEIPSKGFKVIRTVCLNFEYGDVLTMSEFNTLVYGPYSANRTTVYFTEWRGLATMGRITVTQSGCYNTGVQEHMPPSFRLIKHVDRYISDYLQDSDFIAIIARIEKAKKGLGNRDGSIKYCLTKTLENWKQFSAKSNLRSTFLSIDMGKYGSNSFKQNASVQQDFENFFHGMYGSKWSIKEWERSFKDIGNTNDAGYIALLQKMIVTRAKCILFVGGGSFQKHALALYQARVPEANWCIQSVHSCTRTKHLKLTQA